MLRASAIAVLTLALVATAGVWTAQGDVDQELQSILRLARTLERLTPPGDGAAAVALLSSDGAPAQGLRHLSLGLRDADGRVRLQWPAQSESSAWIDALARLPARWGAAPELPPVVWALPQRDGPPWTLTLVPDPLSERREALADLVRVLLLMSGGTVVLLSVLGWSVRRSLHPLRQVAQALVDIRPGETAAAHGLRDVRLLEIDQVTHAVRRLARALDQSEAERRVLAQKLQSLQETERVHLARELHDEWGQRLTSLRLDAAWLGRHLQDNAPLAEASQRLGQQCASLQEDLRQRLRALAPRDLGDGNSEGLRQALQELADGWSAPGRGKRLAVAFLWEDQRASASLAGKAPPVSAELLLAIYRMSQEGLTNVARHASATQVLLSLRIEPSRLSWQLSDDGIGIPDVSLALQRGTGLTSLRQRAWSHGCELALTEATPGAARPGLCLSAAFDLPQTPTPGDAD